MCAAHQGGGRSCPPPRSHAWECGPPAGGLVSPLAAVCKGCGPVPGERYVAAEAAAGVRTAPASRSRGGGRAVRDRVSADAHGRTVDTSRKGGAWQGTGGLNRCGGFGSAWC